MFPDQACIEIAGVGFGCKRTIKIVGTSDFPEIYPCKLPGRILQHCNPLPPAPPLFYHRVNVPAKPCTPSTRRMCRTSVPVARPLGRSPCRCPCAAPTAPLSTTRSSTPCSAGAPPGSAASEATALGTCCRLPHRRWDQPECCCSVLLVLRSCALLSPQ